MRCGWLLRGRGCARTEEVFHEVAGTSLVLFGLIFAFHGAESGEEELRNVSEGDGVAAGDAFVSKLPDEIAEEEIHLVGGDELIDPIEELARDDFGIWSWKAHLDFVCVIGAEGRALGSLVGAVMVVNRHVAAVATGILVLALRIDVKFRRHGLAFRVWSNGKRGEAKKEDPLPPCF